MDIPSAAERKRFVEARRAYHRVQREPECDQQNGGHRDDRREYGDDGEAEHSRARMQRKICAKQACDSAGDREGGRGEVGAKPQAGGEHGSPPAASKAA